MGLFIESTILKEYGGILNKALDDFTDTQVSLDYQVDIKGYLNMGSALVDMKNIRSDLANGVNRDVSNINTVAEEMERLDNKLAGF